MRHVASLMVVSWLGGCSLLYNPSNIDKQMDAPGPDSEPVYDADPTMLAITGVKPGMLVEGAGVNGSRRAVIVIDGMHMVPDGATVAVAPTAPVTKTPMVMVDNTKLVVEANGTRIAVPITLPVDSNLGAADVIPMDVTVTQLANGAMVTKTMSAAFTIKGLPELDTAAPQTFSSGPNEFSIVNLKSGATFSVATGQTSPIVITSTSSLTVDAAIAVNVDAAEMTPGPAGGLGGAGGAGGVLNGTTGSSGGGPAKGLPSGGAGGFGGDPQLSTLADPNRSSGGAGGNGLSLGAKGGNGGAGGGSIMFSGDGDVSIGAISAKGAGGTTPAGANPGGGGSGGVVFVHAGGTLVLGAVDVSGPGATGRGRYDAGGPATVTNAGGLFRGPSFVNAPLIVTDERPMIPVSGGGLKAFQFYWSNDTGQMIRGAYRQTFPNNGTADLAFPAGDGGLFRGLNELCLLVENAQAASDTKTCIRIAYLYKPTS